MNINQTQNPMFLRWLMRSIRKGATVLDVGCGTKWYHGFIDAEFTSIDAWGSNKPDHVVDLESEDIPDIGTFDVALVLDVIEHLSKDRGLEILEQVEGLCKKVIILTPLGWDDNTRAVHSLENPYQEHKSLWSEDDFPGWSRIKLHCFEQGVNSDPKYVDGSFLGVWE